MRWRTSPDNNVSRILRSRISSPFITALFIPGFCILGLQAQVQKQQGEKIEQRTTVASLVELLAKGRIDDALAILEHLIRSHADDASAYNLMARAYYEEEDWDLAIAAAEKSTELAPQNSDFHLWLGRCYGRKAELLGKEHPLNALPLVRKVKAEFEAAATLNPNNRPARADLVEFYTEAPSIMGGDKSKATHLASDIAAADPALSHYLAARIQEKMGQPQLGEEEFKKAIAAAGNGARHWVDLASFYHRQGRSESMENAIHQSLEAPNSGGIALFDGASLLLATGRNASQAITMLRSYVAGSNLSEDGPAFKARTLLGQLLEKEGSRQAAAEEYRAALALASQYPPARDALARLSR